MKNIKQLDKEYTINKKLMNLTMACGQSLVDVQKENDILTAIRKSVEILQTYIVEAKTTDVEAAEDSLYLALSYIDCVSCIDDFEKRLYEISDSPEAADIVISEKERLLDTKRHHDGLKESFFAKYHKAIENEKDILQAMHGGLEYEMARLEKVMESIREEARKLYENKETLYIGNEMRWNNTKELPQKIFIAKSLERKTECELLRDIGFNEGGQEYIIDYKNKGNILISSAWNMVRDKAIDDFVVAYVFKALEMFPMGSLNIHIFDRNPDILYKRLYNGIQSGEANENTKRIVQIHTSLGDLNTFRDVNCEDILKKTNPSDRPDLYSVYQTDRSDPFNLVILREGILDGSGHVSSEFLDVIEYLTNPGGVGHVCGFRFLIIDNSSSFERGVTPAVRSKISQISDNCEMKLEYADGKFEISKKKVEVLHISGDVGNFVQDQTQKLMEISNKQGRETISLDETMADKAESDAGSILYIPVGIAGDKVIEIPFSCKDEEGKASGSCIGYMVIGQTGSGKSSFFHSMIFNGCLKYSPKDLQFWLLDFKNGNATSKYRNSGIPHIRIISENNRIDDALCLFQMILEEMDRRTVLFNQCFTSNIVDYNARAKQHGQGDVLPRIIIAIDEVQEIFRDDNASVLNKQISSIASRMRSTGMHFVMVSQNLSEGKTYMLKESFMPSARGRICFRVEPDIPRDSSFGDEFVQRKQEIAELKTGEAYISYGKDTIQKIKMVLVEDKDMEDKYFRVVRDRYPEFADLKPKIIGSKIRLSITSLQQGGKMPYEAAIREVKASGDLYRAVIGEDTYRMTPLTITFSQNDNSALMLLGSDKQIASSLCTSVFLSLMRQNAEMHLFNGDRTKVQTEYTVAQHSFMYVCQSIGEEDGLIHNHKMKEFCDVMKELFEEYLNRQRKIQEAEDEDPEFRPIFLIVNDLLGIESFINDEMIVCGDQDPVEEASGGLLDDSALRIFGDNVGSRSSNRSIVQDSVQSIIETMINNGWRYNIHLILAIRGNSSNWRGGRIVSEVKNVVLFNSTDYSDEFENSYYLKEMLKNITNDNQTETMAVLYRQRSFSKIRPFIYDLSEEREKELLSILVKGV